MRIVHLSTNQLAGGAARAAHRLHTGLRRANQDSSMFVLHRSSPDPAVTAFDPPMDPLSRVRRHLRQTYLTALASRYERSHAQGSRPFSDDRTRFGCSVMRQLPRSDVINLHWIAGFVDYRPFFQNGAPHSSLVWTLHDMNPFTGGCHYDGDCGLFTDHCGSCPQLKSHKQRDLSWHIWERKRQAFSYIEAHQMHIVTPSRWLAREVERSALLGRFPVSVIPNGVDTDVFAPRPRQLARRALEVPLDAAVVMFASASTRDKRKGFDLLVQALGQLGRVPHLCLVSVGKGGQTLHGSIPHRHLGFVGDDRLLALVYSAADIFVIPSLQDNLPNTVLESFACGTPAVGFDVGGIPDMVRPGITGKLASVGDVDVLAESIGELLEDAERRKEMSANCRRIAVEEYALEVQARRYAELYNQMLDQ